MTALRHYVANPLLPHQKEGRRLMQGREGFALLMEQGTGKSITLLDEALQLYAEGEIDALFVLAPNGVHENWVLDEVPKHVPKDIPHVAAYYVGQKDSNRRERAAMDAVFTVRKVGAVPAFRVLGMSYDSLLTDEGWEFAISFIRACRCMLVADEAQKLKNPSASRTKRALNLRKHAKVKRIATGTAVTNSPLDAFSQFEFLEPGCLGTEDFSVFRAEYCELLTQGHGLVRHLIARMERSKGREMSAREKEKAMPAVIAKDSMGRPIYKNLDKLRDAIAEHSYRVLKEDCLNLPPKVFETCYFRLTKMQRKVYETMEEEQRFILEDQTLLATSKLVAMGKLRQITSGFLLMRNGAIAYTEDNPRIDLLRSMIEEEAKQGIIWAQYKEEIDNIVKMVRKLGMTIEAVNGDVSMTARRKARSDFQDGKLQWIVAHPAAMGTGYTLTAAEEVIYYSNGFSLEERLQSEDRAHRIGQTRTVRYRDLVAIDTRDDDVVWALQNKLDVAAMISGDPQRQSRFQDRRA